jgi:hypothetical protein
LFDNHIYIYIPSVKKIENTIIPIIPRAPLEVAEAPRSHDQSPGDGSDSSTSVFQKVQVFYHDEK